MSTVRNVVAIELFVIAGFCVAVAQVGAFTDFGDPGAMHSMIGVTSVISVVLLTAGAFAGTFRPRARSVGVVLITVSVITVLTVISGVAILLSPTTVEILNQSGVYLSPSMFQAGPGVVAIAVPALAGVWLVQRR